MSLVLENPLFDCWENGDFESWIYCHFASTNDKKTKENPTNPKSYNTVFYFPTISQTKQNPDEKLNPSKPNTLIPRGEFFSSR